MESLPSFALCPEPYTPGGYVHVSQVSTRDSYTFNHRPHLGTHCPVTTSPNQGSAKLIDYITFYPDSSMANNRFRLFDEPVTPQLIRLSDDPVINLDRLSLKYGLHIQAANSGPQDRMLFAESIKNGVFHHNLKRVAKWSTASLLMLTSCHIFITGNLLLLTRSYLKHKGYAVRIKK